MDLHSSDKKSKIGYLVLLIVIAYLFSIAIRYIWVDWASGFPQFYWNGELMINTNDGYYFASGAQKELFGTLQHNPRVPDLWYTATVTLSYYAAKLLPFSLDTIIFYMPAVISSLVVIPIILIGRLYGMTLIGFFAALLGAVTWSYYNRTMVGYYDTDMFSAMAPMFIVYFLLAANHRRSMLYALFAALTLIAYPYLYNQGKAMVFAISVIYIAYVWWYHRKEPFAYPAIAVVAAAMLPLWWPLKLTAVVLVYLIYRSGKLGNKQQSYLALGLTLIALALGDGFNFAYHKMLSYAVRENAEAGLHFYNVKQTIREAGHIPFEILAKRISGSVPAFFLALIGYGLLLWRHRAFVVTLPLMGLGLFAWWGGLRFTVYAVPVAAFGLAYLFGVVAGYFVRDEKIRYGLVGILSLAALFPNITHVIGYKVPTVFTANEVKVLDRLRKEGSDRDYVIAWWDYGYPIWYYGNKNTLVDGGKHQNDNFIVSEILTTDSQLEAARLARIAVETYVASGYKTVADTLFKNRQPDQVDPTLYLETLKTAQKIDLPKKSREVYLFLPWKMAGIFPTVRLFSAIDLSSGKNLEKGMFYQLRAQGERNGMLLLGRGVSLDRKKGVLHIGKRTEALKRFVSVQLRKGGKAIVRSQTLHRSGDLSLIHLKSYGRYLLVDERMFNSVYVQLFFLRKYDPQLFEPVVSSPYGMVYRVKL